MRKLIIVVLFWVMSLGSVIYALWDIWSSENILNQNSTNALNVTDINDPLRDWTHQVISADWTAYSVSWIVDVWKIDSFKDGGNTAEYHVMKIIKTFTNRALWMLWLVALVYLIYHGFLMVTAAWDDAQFKKWIKWLKYAAIALTWIALSWFVISFIFWLITKFTTPTV